jgi:hypothetical protein
VRHAQPLGQHDAHLRVPLVVGLQAGEHEIEPLVGHGRGQRRGRHERIGRAERIASSTWMARSAPRASASRITCCTRAGPAEQTTTSPPCFSRSRSASSSA